METEDEASNALVGTGQPWLDLDEDHASTSTRKQEIASQEELGGVAERLVVSAISHESENEDFSCLCRGSRERILSCWVIGNTILLTHSREGWVDAEPGRWALVGTRNQSW